MGAIITERRVIGMFYEALQQAIGASWINDISTPIINSDQDSEDFGWIGQVPQMAEKRGEKKFSELGLFEWIVKNVEYQAGIKLPEKWILYDKTSQVQVRVNELAVRAMAHWAKLIATLIVDGESNTCYDGQFFFDTDHSEGGSGAQDNDITFDVATPADPTAVEMIDAILAGVEQMLGFKDDQGEYVNEGMNDFLILLGTPLMTAGLQALSQSRISGGDTNILIEQDSFRLRVQATPRLSSWTDRFAIFGTQGTQKPIIRQQRVPNNAAPGYTADGMRIQSLWLDSEHNKKHGECLVSVETERSAAYGDWKKACLVTLT